MIQVVLLAALLAHGPGETRQSIGAGGRMRTFLLYQPTGLPDRAPLLIALHGRLGTGAGMERLTHFEAVADREKFLLIFPDGVKKSWNDGRGTPAERRGVDDVGFIRALIDSAVRHCGADPRRIYVTGISNGGFMTMRLAAELSDKIAAVAVVAATMDQQTVDRARGVHPLSVLLLHGTKDPLVPFGGGAVHSNAGGPILSHDASVNWWVKLDECQPSPTVRSIPDSAGDGTAVTVRDYPGGKEGTEVLDYVIANGGHTWPGGWQYLPVLLVGRTSRNLDASEAIWVFFKRHGKK
ncbi:MAG TPA: PHB depolymerase family esterase [Puia sp.]|nr:PHB depolymerase family esterase [Puia sp.]